jgi:hypothetical protein
MLLKEFAEAVTLLTCTWKMHGYQIFRVIDYPKGCFTWFSLVPERNWRDIR